MRPGCATAMSNLFTSPTSPTPGGRWMGDPGHTSLVKRKIYGSCGRRIFNRGDAAELRPGVWDHRCMGGSQHAPVGSVWMETSPVARNQRFLIVRSPGILEDACSARAAVLGYSARID